jgi:pilus assembly protein CpaC
MVAALGSALAVLTLGSCTRALHDEGPPRPPNPGLDQLKASHAKPDTRQSPEQMRSLIEEAGSLPSDVEPLAPTGTGITKTAASFVVQSGKSRLIELDRPVRRVSVGEPEVADIILVSPTSILVNGRRSGDTSLILWDQKGVSEVHTISVEEQSERQVILEVTVAELNRTAMEQHGVDYRVLRSDLGLVFLPAQIAPLVSNFPATTGQPQLQMHPTDNVTLGIVDPKHDVAAFFQFIQNEGLGKILARPRLVARSGHEAKFLSGGEIPIIIAEALQTSVTFKEFGTRVRFKPIVLADDTIDLEVAPEVSEPDPANGVTLFGFSVPAFVTRRADTRVTLRNGESLVIAGLFRDNRVESTQKVPYLGDVPFLGYLFRKTSFTREKSELMIVVRPRLAEATPPGVAVQVPDREPFQPGETNSQATNAPVTRPRLSRPLPPDAPSRDASFDPEGEHRLTGWSVEVLTTGDGDEADALVESLRQRGFKAHATPRRDGSGVGTIFHVRVGPYVTTEDAIAEGERLRLERDVHQATVVSE